MLSHARCVALAEVVPERTRTLNGLKVTSLRSNPLIVVARGRSAMHDRDAWASPPLEARGRDSEPAGDRDRIVRGS